MAGTFDDLIPNGNKSVGGFNDLIPTDHSNTVNNSLAQTVNKPFELPAAKGTIKNRNPLYDPRIPRSAQGPETTTDIPWTDEDKAVANSGVDIITGAPYGLRNLVDLASTEKEKLAAINHYFASKGIYQEGARIGPVSHEIEYKNPDTGRYTLYSPRTAGLSAPTVPNAATQLMTGTGATVGAFFGGIPGAAFGAGTGRWAAETGKMIINAALGNSRGDTGEYTRNLVGTAGGEALASLAGSGASFVGNKLGKFVIYGPIAKDVFSKAEAPLVLSKAQEAQESLADYYKLADSRNFKPDVAQLSGDPAAHLAMQHGALGSEYTQIMYKRRQDANISDLQQTFKKVTDAYKDPDVPPLTSGQGIQEWQQQLRDAQKAQLELQKSVAEGEAKRQAGGYVDVNKTDAVQRVTEALNLIKDEDKAGVDKAYGDLAVKLGVPAQVAYEKNSDRLLQSQQFAIPFQFSKVGLTKLNNMLDEAVRLGNVDPDLMKAKMGAIPEGWLFKDEEGKPGIVNDPKDLYAVIQSLQSLRTGLRAANFRSKGILEPDAQAMAQVAEIMRNDITEMFRLRGDPEVLDTFEQAEQAAKQYAMRWRGTILGEAAKKQDGYTTPTYNQGVAQALLSNNREANRELAGILDGDPMAKDEVRQMLLGIYRNHYMNEDGTPTPRLHQKFLKDFQEPLNAFFTMDENKQLGQMGQFAKTIEDATAKIARLNQAWNSQPFGKLASMNSLAISRAAFSNSKDLAGVGTWLARENPELLKQLQSDTAQQIADRVMGKGTISTTQLDNILSETKYPAIRDIMPHEYMANLRTIANAAKIQGRLPEEFKTDPNLLKYAVRGVIGYFGPEARWYHFMTKVRQLTSSRLMYNALSSPENMQEFIKAQNLPVEKARRAGVLSVLGADALGLDYNQNLATGK